MSGRGAGAFLPAFAGLRVLVVGDALLDVYVDAAPRGQAREAPVPTLRVSARHEMPGGAANLAVNLAALGAAVELAAVTGADPAGAALRAALAGAGVDPLTPADPGRPTATATRVRVGGEVVVRLDDGVRRPPGPGAAEAVSKIVARRWPAVDAVVVSDYQRGALHRGLRRELAAHQARRPQLLVVDAKRVARYRATGPTAVTPNWAEAARLLGLPGGGASGADRAATVAALAGELLARSGARLGVVTLDADGAVLVEPGRAPHRCAGRPLPASSSIGAGDAFTAAFTLALAVGATGPEAVELASGAARAATGHGRTAVCTAAALAALVDGGTPPSPAPVEAAA